MYAAENEIFDKETGCRHLAQVAWNAIALLWISKHREGDIAPEAARKQKLIDDFWEVMDAYNDIIKADCDAISSKEQKYMFTDKQINKAIKKCSLDNIKIYYREIFNYDDKAEELLNGHSPAGPWRGNKYSAFEGGTAVPAIVRWPKKIKENRESDVLMSQIDWMASLGALVNARLPKGSAPDSYNRIGNLLGTDDEDRPWVIELASNHVLSVRTKDWKYIEPNDGPAMIQWGPKIETGNLSTPQLYDMRKDINERANVASQHPEVVYDMQNILRRVRNKTIKME